MPNGQNYRQQRINYALAATLLTQGVPFADIVPQVGAKNVNTLRVGLARKGVTLRVTQSIPPTVTHTSNSLVVQVAAQASAIMQEASAKLRGSLASVSQASAGVLDAKPPKNVKEVIQRASALKSLVEAGDKLHGWSAQASAPAWNVTILDRERPALVESPALDVVEVPACASDTPSGSVPDPVPIT